MVSKRHCLFATANAEHTRPTVRANTLIGWFTIFHGDSLGIFHFFLRATLYTICFHLLSPNIRLFRSYFEPGD